MNSLIMAIILFLLFASHSCSGRLLESNLFIASDNPSASNPNIHSVVNDASRLEEDAVLHCDEEISPWSGSSEKSAAKDQNKLSSGLTPVNIQNKNQADEPPIVESVFHLPPKGNVTPSGPGPKVNSMVTEQRLSTSKRSPGVGHMQMVRPKSQTINGEKLRSHHSNGDDKRNKRKLRSTPSPGVGH